MDYAEIRSSCEAVLAELGYSLVSEPDTTPCCIPGRGARVVRDGVEFHRQKNYGKAFECWDAHARRGSSAAQFNIARMYILGEGVPRNNIEAYKWLTIADRSGRPEARAALVGARGGTPESALCRAAAARAEGRLAEEIAPLTVPPRIIACVPSSKRASSSFAISAGSTLIATSRSRRVSRAR